ncbi:MAG: hypothetical protein ACK4K7_03180 [Allosphingosinicella sp.]|uniref:hypothetical protein n=1 Tax=Allosphingosinicella sp. TaxID=2823234 RepID=UPI0039534DB0
MSRLIITSRQDSRVISMEAHRVARQTPARRRFVHGPLLSAAAERDRWLRKRPIRSVGAGRLCLLVATFAAVAFGVPAVIWLAERVLL